MSRLLDPASIAIVGISDDPAKHGGRVLRNLRALGFAGTVWGVNPRLPRVEGVDVFADSRDLPGPPDLVVSAVPAAATPDVVRSAGDAGAGTVVVFAGGFAEAGPDGGDLQQDLVRAARESGVRVLGPNSGGVIRPDVGLAASFLTCLDRPPGEIRTGPVGLVTQSGGTGSYVHNLAAAAGSGLAASISTGNEADLGLADGIDELLALDGVKAIALVMETVRDGPAFLAAAGRAVRAGVPIVACRIGRSDRGRTMMTSHTGAKATPHRVLDGVLDAMGVTVTETPEEMLAVAEVLARTPAPPGPRIGVVTHSGGIAILLADLADRRGLTLPPPGPELTTELQPLLSLGSASNPLDMGGIIGGPGRFAEVIERFAGSGDFDVVMAVTTAHPPAHTAERAAGLVDLRPAVPVVHLWMGGDQAAHGLMALRSAERPVVTEPRAAVAALAALTRPAPELPNPAAGSTVVPVPGTEHETKALLSRWGLPVVEGGHAADEQQAASLAERLGGRLVVKVSAPGLAHKTDIGGVITDVSGPEAAVEAHRAVVAAGRAAGAEVDGSRIERMRPGVEVIVGMVRDDVFGPVVMVGAGGTGVDGRDDATFAPLPAAPATVARMVSRIPGLERAVARRGGGPDAMAELASIVATAAASFAESGLDELEMNPVAWTDSGWEILDAVAVGAGSEGDGHGQAG